MVVINVPPVGGLASQHTGPTVCEIRGLKTGLLHNFSHKHQLQDWVVTNMTYERFQRTPSIDSIIHQRDVDPITVLSVDRRRLAVTHSLLQIMTSESHLTRRLD